MLPANLKTKPAYFLSRDRVQVLEDCILVTFLHTKTIQFGERVLVVPLLRSDSPLCPVAAYRHASLLSSASAPADSAFAFREGSAIKPLLPTKFVATFRQLLARAGVSQASDFRGHSFRRGGASWAFNNGVPGELIQVMGDWKSDAYKVYLEYSMSSKMLLAQRLVSSLPLLAA